MTAEARAILLAIHAKGLNGKFVFIENDRTPVKYAHVYRRFHQAQKRAGITNKIRFHNLKHTFTSNYMMNRGNVFDLQKLLGHTKIEMTMRYAHFSPTHLQSTLQFMSMMDKNEQFTPYIDHREKIVENNVIVMNV